MQTSSSYTLSKRSTMRGLKLKTRQGEQEHPRLLHRAHRRQHEPSVLKLPAVQNEGLLQRRRQLAERRPTCPTVTLRQVLHRLRPRESPLHLPAHQSQSSGHLLRSQMLASLQIYLHRHQTERGRNQALLPGHLHPHYHRRHQYLPKTNLWGGSLAYRLPLQATEFLQEHHLHLQVAAPCHLRPLRGTLLQRLLHCRRRHRGHHFRLLHRQ